MATTAIAAEFGALAELIDDPGVTDIVVNGPSDVWVDRGRGLQRAAVRFAGEAEVRSLGRALIARGGRHVDEAHPIVDVRIGPGIRVHVVLPPVAVTGTLISIRVPARGPIGLAAFCATGTLPQVQALLRDSVADRMNILISGAAGSGKTTLLAALLGQVADDQRIVCIEDVAEIVAPHPHLVRLEARQANIEGAGEVTMADLVRAALRMRPDRIVVGECRGAEVRELLTALNTGHSGGLATIHANSARDVAARLEALGALGGLNASALAAQAMAAIGLIAHVERTSAGRRVAGLSRLVRTAGGELGTVEVA